MSNGQVTADYKANQTVYYNGSEAKVVSSYLGFVVIEDSQGEKHTVAKSILMTTPIFGFMSKQERDDLIAHYQKQGEQAGIEKADFATQIKDFLAQMGLYDKESKEFKLLKNDLWAAIMDRTAAHNREYSAYLHAAMVASDPIC